MNYRLSAFADEADKMISGQIAAMQRNGISLLEIRGVDGENISKISLEKAREVDRRLKDGGIAVWSIGSPTGKITLEDDFEAHLDDFKRMIEIAYIMDAKNFRLFSFHEAYEKPQEVLEKLNCLAEASKGSGVTLCLENEKKVYGDEPQRMLEIVKALPSIRTVFDPANYVQCGVDTLKAWEMLKDYTEYLHIKDAVSTGLVVPAGHGEGNVAFIVEDYLKRGGEVMTLEPHLSKFCGLDALEKEEQKSVVGSLEFRYKDNDEAFDAAVDALKAILTGVK